MIAFVIGRSRALNLSPIFGRNRRFPAGYNDVITRAAQIANAIAHALDADLQILCDVGKCRRSRA